jgi:integrase
MACIRKRRGRWVIDFYDQSGKRRWKTLRKGAAKGKAKEELRSIEEMVEKGIYLPSNRMPTFDRVAQNWLEYKKPKIRITTWEVHEGHVRNHLKQFDGVKINWIATATIEKLITDWQNESMNIKTLRKILGTFNQIMNYAVRHRYIDHNPYIYAEKPRGQGGVSNDRIRILTPAQIKAFLDAEGEQKYRTLFTLAVFSGARQGELLGLKWSDVHWENCQIHIERTYNKRRFFGTKTKASKRCIDLGPKVMTELRKWRLACPVNDLGLMFPNDAGGPINYSNMVLRHFLPALKAAGLPRIRFHDLRHTYASLLIEQGENIKYIQTQLGHSSPTVTWNVYAHLMKPTNQEAACRLERAIFDESGSKMVAEMKKGIMVQSITP